LPIEPYSEATLERAAALIRGGAVVAFPTETVYGLGANALDARAIARIFEIKKRPSFDPLIVHVYDESMLKLVAASVPAAAKSLMQNFWPGPLTIVFRKTERVPELVTSGLPTVAVRMPAHPVARALLQRANVPLAAPSANRFGSLSPTRAEHVARSLGDLPDLIVDGGPAEHGVESTIVLLEPVPTLLRPGAIALEAIEAVIGPVARELAEETQPLAPGRLPQHYAPSTPIRIVADASATAQNERANAALLAFRRDPGGYSAARVLSAREDLREAASRLFESLHELDALALARIDVEAVPETGIGVAIMDRLRRAAAR
jgi:L-threonylcarbamoyladenylate synthase